MHARRLGRTRPATVARVAAICLALPLIVSGCLSRVLPEAAPAPVTLDFGPLPEDAPPPLPLPFRLDRVTAPSWLESTNIYYRRLDEQPAALTPYARNVWIASVPELFAERLAYRLEQAVPDDLDAEPAWLEIELVSFEHVYTSTSDAYVIARARAAFEDRAGRTRSRAFEVRRPAPANVGGAIAELPAAADDLMLDVVAWQLQEVR